MRSHELELIAALVEGTLEDEGQARALIESSSEMKEEYEAQRAARAALLSVSPAALTEVEKAAMHRDIWTELRAQPTDAARTPWYYRWVFSGAAVLLIGVGLLAVLNQGVSDQAATAGPEEVSENLAEGEADSSSPIGGDDGAGIAAVDTTEATSADEAMAELLQDPLTAYLIDRADVARQEGAEGVSAPETDPHKLAESNASCLQTAGLDNYVTIAKTTVDDARLAGLETDKNYLLAIPSGEDLSENTPIAFVDSTECLLVHLDE